VPKGRRRTDLIAERGENLVKNAFLEILQWVPRTDDPDDGIDLSVEIPSHDNRPTERFLVQVKTASAIKPRRNGAWSASIARSAAKKYQRSRPAVFLFRVDLKSSEIRWIDLLEALRNEPNRLTFSLPPGQKLDQASADAFRAAVRKAIEAQDDRHHPPAQALAYRAQQLAAKDSRLAVQGEIVNGLERYTFTAKEAFQGRLKVVPRTKSDVKRLVEAHAYGSKAQIKLKSFRIEGSPALEQEGPSGSHLTIEPYARKFRLGVAASSHDAPTASTVIELDAELARGSRGWEVRSADPECPLDLVLKLDTEEDDKNRITIDILYERWNSRPFAQLPIVEQLATLARCIAQRGKLIFESIEFGVHRQILSTEVQAYRGTAINNMVGYLNLLSHVSHICRHIGSQAIYNSSETIDQPQVNSFSLAYKLTTGQTVSFNGFSSKLTLTPEGREAFQSSSSPCRLTLSMPLRLFFGKTFVGDVPVKVPVDDYSITENADGTVTLRPRSAVAVALDTDVDRRPSGVSA
jgi:hypothetical protein